MPPDSEDEEAADASDVDALKDRVEELEAALIEQEHRVVKVFSNAFDAYRREPDDPKRKAAFWALFWRWLAPTTVVGGGIGVGVVVSLLTLYELRRQNDAILEQVSLQYEQAKSTAAQLELQREQADLSAAQHDVLVEGRDVDQWEYELSELGRRLECIQREDCAAQGRCVPWHDTCVTNDASCEMSAGCDERGDCVAWMPDQFTIPEKLAPQHSFGVRCVPSDESCPAGTAFLAGNGFVPPRCTPT